MIIDRLRSSLGFMLKSTDKKKYLLIILTINKILIKFNENKIYIFKLNIILEERIDILLTHRGNISVASTLIIFFEVINS